MEGFREPGYQGHGQDWHHAAGIDLRWWMRVIEAITYLLVGAVYTFGPPTWHSSGNFAYINALGVPFVVWSLLLMVGGMLLLINFWPYNWITYMFLLVVSIFWATAQEIAVLTAPPPGPPGSPANPLSIVAGGGPIWVYGIAGFNALFLAINAKEYVMIRDERKKNNAA